MWINGIYLLTGALGGTIIGALGSGSSLIILPILTITFTAIYPEAIALKFAVATCMATLVIGTLSGAVSYIQSKLYNAQIVKYCLPGLITGSLIAPILSTYIPSNLLKIYIGLSITLIAIYKLSVKQNKKMQNAEIKPILFTFMSFICAVLSGLAGVAFGILMIPYLSRYLAHSHAIGTNLLLAVPYSVFGSLGYFFAASQMPVETNSLTIGFIYIPAFIAIASAMVFFPPIGLKIAKKVGSKSMQRLFYCYLLAAGIAILI